MKTFLGRWGMWSAILLSGLVVGLAALLGLGVALVHLGQQFGSLAPIAVLLVLWAIIAGAILAAAK